MSGRAATQQIRRATVDDLPRLQAFFEQAYGPRTVFRDAGYLRWFFGTDTDALNAQIAVDRDGAVIAHYGWLPEPLIWGGELFPHIWGVNVFTLPAARGSGIGSAIVEAVKKVSPSFGVAGFNARAADFYRSVGFNLFGDARFDRHVLPLSPAAEEIAGTEIVGTTDAVEAAPADVLTSARAPAWLAWRYAPASLLEYRVSERGGALIAYREIELRPAGHRITKVVDLAGAPAGAAALLNDVCRDARAAGHAFVDFWSLGVLHRDALADLGFVTLAGDDAALLPSRTDPVESSPNMERICLFTADSRFHGLGAGDVYFTPSSSDRDRRASL